MSHSLVNTFLNSQIPPQIEKTDHIFLTMLNGDRYLDFTGGFTSHAILGWTQPKVEEAIIKQLNKFAHIDYKNYSDENRYQLADLLLSRAEHNLDKVFFVGASGSEACEAALKISFQSHYNQGNTSKAWFISREQSYHGSTTHAMALGSRPNLDFFKPTWPSNVAKIPEHNEYRHKLLSETSDEYSKRSALFLEKKILEIGPENVAGFVAETMLGGLVGDVPPSKNYWKYIKKICTKYNVHLILDEVWCGTGTSGKIYCIDWDGITPDILFMGKTLGAGFLPISCLLTSNKILNPITAGQGSILYSNTFQGHSTCVAAALAVQKIIHNDQFLNEVNIKGNLLRNTLESELNDHPFFKNVRGRGLRNSIEYDCSDVHLFSLAIADEMKEKYKILISSKWHRTSFTPALTVTNDEINRVIKAFVTTIKNISKNWTNLNKNKIKIKPMF